MASLVSLARRACAASLVFVMAAMVVVVASSPALAHESREVGPYTLTVGWITEPAYSGLPNSVSLRIRDTETEEGIEEQAQNIMVDIVYGEEMLTAPMRAAFNDPGHYRSDLVPSRPGTWAFRFYGTIEDLEIDELFTSGPETFNDLQDIALASWPAQDPGTAEIAERLERELARIDEQLAGAPAMQNGDATDAGDDTADDMADDEEMADIDARLTALESTDTAAGETDDNTSSNTPGIVLGIAAVVLAVIALGVSLVSRKS